MTAATGLSLRDPFDPVPFDQRSAMGIEDKSGVNQEMVAAWLRGEDIDDGGKTYKVPSRPYKSEPWIRKAVQIKAQSVASVPLMVTTLDGDIIEDGPLVEFLKSDAVMQGTRGLVAQYVGHFELSGEAHLVYGFRSPREQTIDVFGAYNMTALLSEDGYDLIGWEGWINDKHGRRDKHVIERMSVDSWIDNSLYPDCRFRGLSKLESLALTLSESDSAAEHNATLLARGGGPKGLLKTEQTLTKEQSDQLEERWRSKYGGVGNTGKIAVLGRGADWVSIAQSNRDMMLIESRKFDRETILSIYDVPPAVAGINDGGIKSHDTSAREGFWVNTIWPLATIVGENLTKSLVPRFTQVQRKLFTKVRGKAYRGADYRAAVARAPSNVNVIIWFDMHQVPALRQWQWSQAQTLTQLVETGIPLNEAIEKLDMPFTPDKVWGDTWWVPAGLTPAEIAMDRAENPPEPPAGPGAPANPDYDPAADPSQEDAASKSKSLADDAVIWSAYVNSWSGLESQTRIAVERYWFGQRKRILARLESMYGKAAGDAGYGVPTHSADYRDALPDIISENQILVDVMDPELREGLSLGGQQIATETGGVNPFALEDEYFQRFLPQRFSKLQMTVNPTTYSDLQAIMTEAQAAGEGMTALANRIKGYYQGQIDTGRSLTIARTEGAMSVSQGRAEGMRVNGVKGKGWLSAMDEHTRPAHAAAGQRYRDKGIPLPEKFEVGGELLDHPCDPAGSAANVINCRCLQISAELGKAYYLEKGFVKWQKSKTA